MKRLRQLFALICFPLLILGFCSFLLTGYIALHLRGEIDYGEGIVLWQAAHVTDWAAAYHPVEVYPHIVFHYTPVFHLASRAMAVATGDLLMAGRLVSLLSMTFVCLILALVAWRCLPAGTDRLTRWIAAMSAGLLIFTFPAWDWSRVMRVDLLALLFTFGGIALFIFARTRPAFYYAAFLLFVAAVYTKQSMLAAPAACFFLLLIERPTRAMRVGAMAVAAGLIPLATLQYSTHGYFLRNTISYNQNPFSVFRTVSLWKVHLGETVAVMSAGFVFPALFFLRVPWRSRHLRRQLRGLLRRTLFGRAAVVTGVYLCLALVTSAGCGKQGSSVNYFLEVDLAMILACGLFLGWVMADRPGRVRGFHLVLTLLITLLIAGHSVRTVHSLYITVLSALRPGLNFSAELIRFLQTTRGPVYSEDMTALMLAGRDLPAEPAIITCLVKNKQWDESGFVQRIAEGRFEAIVVRTSIWNEERFSPEVSRAVERGYRLSRNIGPYQIFAPK